MNPRLARRLASLYPRTWRGRYGDEFIVLLEDEALRCATIVNVAAGALREHVRTRLESAMTIERRLTLTMYACLLAMCAGVNLYWTIDDTPLADAMKAHGALFLLWSVVAWGSLAALTLAAVAAAPMALKMTRDAAATGRYDRIARLMVPVCALAIVVGWASIVAARTHWAPTPWDIAVGSAPSTWPALSQRWPLGLVTALLLAAGGTASAVALKQAIERTEAPPSPIVELASRALAAPIVVIAAAALGWGLLANRSASAVFRTGIGRHLRQHDRGLLGAESSSLHRRCAYRRQGRTWSGAARRVMR
ncbi:MAG: hypothetical protein ACRD1V_17830 [Vicinamibacterales bacterium]